MTMMAWMRSNKMLFAVEALSTPSGPQGRSFSTATTTTSFTIVGGGLAGMSTAVHLLEKGPPDLRVVILDKYPVGCGGASSVAGGLVHPLSPRGKLVHWGLEGLAGTDRLIKLAGKDCVLASKLYRLALTERNVQDLSQTAQELPDLCYWMDNEEIKKSTPGSNTDNQNILGGLCLQGGCQAIHVPTYLQGLWRHCQEHYGDRVEWRILNDNNEVNQKQQQQQQQQDADSITVYCAGAALWQDGLLEDAASLPTQLVRGQSLEMTLPDTDETDPILPVLFGKYVSPIPDTNNKRVLLGATHEFKEEPLTPQGVVDDLRERSMDAVPYLWRDLDNGEATDDASDNNVSLSKASVGTIDRITSGMRVQTNRGRLGRQPLVGRLSDSSWIFTGLSSRGLLHHSVYGDILAEYMLRDDEDAMMQAYPHMQWWKKER